MVGQISLGSGCLESFRAHASFCTGPLARARFLLGGFAQAGGQQREQTQQQTQRTTTT